VTFNTLTGNELSDGGESGRSPAIERFAPLVAMLNWTFTFLLLSLVVGVLWFSGVAGSVVVIAQILTGIFMTLSIGSLVNQERQRRNL
jgi:uncharacterized membrane protein YtjA (UPF0391 family)